MKHLFALAVTVCFSLLMMAQDKDKSKGNEDKGRSKLTHHEKDKGDKDKEDKDHFRFTQDGESASLAGSTVTSGPFNLAVSRGFTTSGGASASLQYTAFLFAPDFSGFTFTNMFGPIPTGAFTGETTKNLALDIDTSTLDPTKFASETCTVVFAPFNQTCGPGPLGLIHLEWRENGAQRTIIDLKQTTFSGPVTTRLHQQSDNSTADVQGSLFGMPASGFSFVSASVGVNHQSTLEITHD